MCRMIKEQQIINTLEEQLTRYARIYFQESNARINNLRGWIEAMFYVLGERVPVNLIIRWEELPKDYD